MFEIKLFVYVRLSFVGTRIILLYLLIEKKKKTFCLSFWTQVDYECEVVRFKAFLINIKILVHCI